MDDINWWEERLQAWAHEGFDVEDFRITLTSSEEDASHLILEFEKKVQQNRTLRGGLLIQLYYLIKRANGCQCWTMSRLHLRFKKNGKRMQKSTGHGSHTYTDQKVNGWSVVEEAIYLPLSRD